MTQITLQPQNQNDLSLILSLAKRLNATIISVEEEKSIRREEKLKLLQGASTDKLFLVDIESVEEDFKYSDAEI
jgi:hypothetical protein